MINWDNIDSNGSDSSFIPKAIEMMMSDVKENREYGYRMLDQSVVFDGLLFESSVYVTPILLDMVEDPSILYKDRIYVLLWELFNADSLIFHGENEKKIPISVKIRILVLNKINVFFEEIRENKFGCRKEALELITSMYEFPLLITSTLKILYEDSGENLIKDYLIEFKRSIEWS